MLYIFRLGGQHICKIIYIGPCLTALEALAAHETALGKFSKVRLPAVETAEAPCRSSLHIIRA